VGPHPQGVRFGWQQCSLRPNFSRLLEKQVTPDPNSFCGRSASLQVFQHSIAQYCIVLDSFVQYCTVLYSIVQCCVNGACGRASLQVSAPMGALSWPVASTVSSTVLYSTYSAVQYVQCCVDGACAVFARHASLQVSAPMGALSSPLASTASSVREGTAQGLYACCLIGTVDPRDCSYSTLACPVGRGVTRAGLQLKAFMNSLSWSTQGFNVSSVGKCQTPARVWACSSFQSKGGRLHHWQPSSKGSSFAQNQAQNEAEYQSQYIFMYLPRGKYLLRSFFLPRQMCSTVLYSGVQKCTVQAQYYGMYLPHGSYLLLPFPGDASFTKGGMHAVPGITFPPRPTESRVFFLLFSWRGMVCPLVDWGLSYCWVCYPLAGEFKFSFRPDGPKNERNQPGMVGPLVD